MVQGFLEYQVVRARQVQTWQALLETIAEIRRIPNRQHKWNSGYRGDRTNRALQVLLRFREVQAVQVVPLAQARQEVRPVLFVRALQALRCHQGDLEVQVALGDPVGIPCKVAVSLARKEPVVVVQGFLACLALQAFQACRAFREIRLAPSDREGSTRCTGRCRRSWPSCSPQRGSP